MVEMTVSNFSLEQICRSGQCFRMEQICGSEQCSGQEQNEEKEAEKAEQEPGTVYSVIAGDRYLKVAQRGEQCVFYCSEAEFSEFWRSYFDLDSDYGACIEKINPRDAYLVNAASFGSGIRILRQDLWEMIVSFLISQQNNIVRIRRCIENLCESYGERMETEDGKVYHAFPAPEALAGLEDDALKACNLGYRSRYVVRAARSVVSGGFDLDAVSRMPYKRAKEELLTLFGVGEKVADCICLFALHHLEAFPVDTHINQAMQKHYKRGFPNRRYRGLQGVMQQYIFYYELFGAK
ncbi:MAG: DNA glycosylase [Lachnospiraceae bacterium]|nr:DNA glycosylase [Lachnospiraceae bacterium]